MEDQSSLFCMRGGRRFSFGEARCKSSRPFGLYLIGSPLRCCVRVLLFQMRFILLLIARGGRSKEKELE
ncbi:unnamed protein product [Prunus armeniaca]